MTGIAHITGERVCGVLAYGRGVIVTTQATVCRLIVGERYNQRCPHGGVMTSFAQITAHRMSRRFKGSWTYTIVATTIGAGLPRHRRMIKSHTQPGGGVMTGITSGGGD